MKKQLNKRYEIKFLINKKGFLLGKTIVELLIAIAAIVILIIFGGIIYGMLKEGSNEKKASDILEDISIKVDYFQNEYSLDEMEFIIEPIKGWFLKSYYIQENAPPTGECVGKFSSCLCICNNADCNKLKSCKGFSDNLVVEEILIDSDGTYASETGEYVEYSYNNVLRFKDSFVKLFIKKEVDKLSLKLK